MLLISLVLLSVLHNPSYANETETLAFRDEYITITKSLLGSGHTFTQVKKRGEEVILSKKTAEPFFRAIAHPPFLVLIWGKGVHGESVTVIEYDKEKKLFSKNSSWPVKISIEKDRMKLEWSGEFISPNKYEAHSRFFKFP